MITKLASTVDESSSEEGRQAAIFLSAQGTQPIEYETPDVAEDAAPCPEFDLLNPPLAEVADFNQKMRWFARLQHARRVAEENVDAIKARINELEQYLIEEMAMHGIEKQTVEGLTIFPQTELIVSKKADKDGVTTEVIVEALRLCGLAYLVSEGYSASALKSKIKEWKENGIDVPPELADKINVFEKQVLRTRKA